MKDMEDGCSRLRLSDAARLHQSGLLLPGRQSVGSLRQFLLALQQLCQRKVWLTVRRGHRPNHDKENLDEQAGLTAQPELITSLFGLQMIDENSSRYRLHWFCQPDGPDQSLLNSIVHLAMNQENVYRLELEIGGAEKIWLSLLLQNGWREEGNIHSGRYVVETSIHEDVYLYALLRPAQSSVGVVFIPFNKAVMAIVGDQEGLIKADFIRYGKRTDDRRIQECAEWLGLLDSQGCLPDRPSVQSRMSGKGWQATPDAPAVLLAAASQVDDYFHGRRRQFDLPMHFEQGSPFQQQVWRALAAIPYGVTQTYEEMACAVRQEDNAEAKKLARAIGSACSANPFPLILPCHRVIGKDGRLVGFSGGLDIKEYLLALEIMGLA